MSEIYISYCAYAHIKTNTNCSETLYKCKCNNCYKFICSKCIYSEDAVIYADKNKLYVVCVDCQPRVVINVETNNIRIRQFDMKQIESQQHPLTKWITKCGFTPLSSKISMCVAAAAVAAAAASVAAVTSVA